MIKDGELVYPRMQAIMKSPDGTPELTIYGLGLIRTAARLSDNELFNPSMICFCDIPAEDLSIHMLKYSRFVLFFSKDLVASQGGSPLFYLSRKSHARAIFENDVIAELKTSNTQHAIELERLLAPIVKELKGLADRGMLDSDEAARKKQERDIVWASTFTKARKARLAIIASHPFKNLSLKVHLDESLSNFPDLENSITEVLRSHGDPTLLQKWKSASQFIDSHILNFLKCYDHDRADDDPDNYYMEREWRVIGGVDFAIEDVKSIIIPEAYSRRLRQDLPEYYGEVFFAPESMLTADRP